MWPEEFVERVRHMYAGSSSGAVLRALALRRPTTFRVNTLRSDPSSVRDELTEAGLLLAPVPFCREAFVVKRGRTAELRKTDAYRSGALYVQGLSSLLPTLALAPRPGELVLDLTAAPGGKTTHIASLMVGEGRIVACDSGPVRIEKLRALVELMGARNVEVVACRGEDFGRSHEARFDRVLLDAPCSSEARMRPGKRGWKSGGWKKHAALQRRLLRSASRAMRPGGVLVYSTCTLAPEENEAIVQMGLEEAGLRPVEVECPVSNTVPGLTAWEDERFDPRVARAVRVLPSAEMEAFFVARMRKDA